MRSFIRWKPKLNPLKNCRRLEELPASKEAKVPGEPEETRGRPTPGFQGPQAPAIAPAGAGNP